MLTQITAGTEQTAKESAITDSITSANRYFADDNTSSATTAATANITENFTESTTFFSTETVIPSATVAQPNVTASAQESVTTAETVTAAVPNPPTDTALQLLSQMSLEEKIGQVILCRYPDSADTAKELQKNYHFGGYTLYAKDFQYETESSIKEKLSALSAVSSIAPFIAADEEGGSVVRISKYSQFAQSPLPSLMEGAKDIFSFVGRMTNILKKGGVNLNLAPVSDVAENEYDYIYDRTCGLGYEETGNIIASLVEELNKSNIMCCLKHFPGYGSNVDTHTGIAVDSRTKSDFAAKDFIPFKKGIEAGAPMVMVNHNIVTAYNKTVPASLAPEIHKALRDLGFDGIIVTDDLGMSAITQYTDNPYTDAFLAGNDLLCATNGAACYNALQKSVASGRISENRLDESVYRILKAKIKYGIIK